jgi:eukaryotic-like serine/threonine-protein kinase
MAISFGKYQISRELGRGAMGIVYEAHDPSQGIEVALKVMTVPKGNSEAKKRQLQRFTQEARALGLLSHHGVARLFDQGEVGGRHFFAMELVRGTTLRDRVQMQGPLSLPELVRLGVELCEVMEHVHQQGVVHRDIKPENIMLMPDGTSRLMDFGIAQITDRTGTVRASGFQGSPAYMSPEQVSGKPLDARSDIYALGITLYEAAAGKRAVDGETIPVIAHQVANEIPPPPPGLPPFYQSVLMKALAKDPWMRYPSAGAMASELRAGHVAHTAALVSGSVPVPPPPPPDPLPEAPVPGFSPPPPVLLGAAEQAVPAGEGPIHLGAPHPALSDFAGDFVPPPPPQPTRPACRAHERVASVALCTSCRIPICYTCLLEVPHRGIICRGCAFKS